MLDFFYTLSNMHVFILLSFIAISVSIAGLFLVRRFIPIELRYKDNPVIGNISALISIIYGVLVGLMALYLINNIGYTSDAVQREANAVADVYRDSLWLKDPAKTKIIEEIKNYLNEVINTEWPTLKTGEKVGITGINIINKISATAHSYANTTSKNSELISLRNITDEIKTLYDAREQRIHMSNSQLSSEVWIVILIGTILTMAINYLFGMNFYLHLITVSAAALMAAAMLFLIITLDRPFQGEFVVNPNAFKAVLKVIENDANVEKSALIQEIDA